MSVDITDNRTPENDGRILSSTFGFDIRAYLSPPANVKKNAITSIKLRIDTVAARYNTNEYVKDVDRPEPAYTVIYDINKSDIPSI